MLIGLCAEITGADQIDTTTDAMTVDGSDDGFAAALDIAESVARP